MQTAPLIKRGTVAASTRRVEPTLAENPRTRRFGINPAVPVLPVHPKLSGQQEENIPFGLVIPFETFVGMHTPNWSVDPEDKSPAYVETDLTAKEAIENVKLAAWQGSRDMGFRELSALTPLKDEEAEYLLALLFVPCDASQCRYGTENTKRLSDGTEVFRCLSCTLDWLESIECKGRAEMAGDAATLLRAQLLDAYQTNEQFFKASWAAWTAELVKRERGESGLSVLGDDHLHVMYQLHQTAPDEKAAETLARNQQAQADAMKEGFREVAQEMARAVQPQQPALDVDEIIRRAKEAAKEELRAEMEAERKPKGK